MTEQAPKGTQREVSTERRITIGGAPVSYVALFAAAIGVTALIPFAVLISTGQAFPFSEFVVPLCGIILGPIGGFVAGLVGGIIGLAIAPYTAPNGILAPLTPALGAMAAGFLVQRDKRAWYGTAILAVALGVFTVKGIVINGVAPHWNILAVLVAWISLVLQLTPLRGLAAKWLRSTNLGAVAAGLVVICFMGTSTAMIVNNAIGFFLFQIPNDVWPAFVPVVQSERTMVTIGSTIIGLGVIAGLRRLRMVKPTQGGWY